MSAHINGFNVTFPRSVGAVCKRIVFHGFNGRISEAEIKGAIGSDVVASRAKRERLRGKVGSFLNAHDAPTADVLRALGATLTPWGARAP